MMRWVLMLGIAVVGCRNLSSSAPSGTVLQMIDQNDADLLERQAPTAFAKVTHFASLAKKKQTEGDTEAASRYEALSRRYLQVAKLSLRKQTLEKQIAHINENNKRLDERIENTQTALERTIAEKERVALRAHIVQVVDETRRRAAAEETLRERGYTGKDKRAVLRAREELGAAMISRAELWAVVIDLAHLETSNKAENIDRVVKPIHAAKSALASVDLAEVQRYVEQADVAYQTVLSDIWHQTPFDPVTVSKPLAEALVQVGFETIDEQIGFSVPLFKGYSEKEYQRLVTVLNRFPDFSLVIVSAWQGTGDAAAESQQAGVVVAEALKRAGFSMEKLRRKAVGESLPLKALKGKDVASALLLVPCPTE